MTEDDWGFDPDFAGTAAPLLDALYTRWWRVRAEGLEQVPATGPALVVANQAGGQPWDAAMLATALRRHDVRPDDPRASSSTAARSSCRGPRPRCAGSAACPRRPATPSACSLKGTW